MARRGLSTFLMAVMVAVMVGLREATGMAPPPPVLGTEEIHWLAPDLDDDPPFELVLPEADHAMLDVAPSEAPAQRRGALHAVRRFLTGFSRR